MKRFPWTVYFSEICWWGPFFGIPVLLIFRDLSIEFSVLLAGGWAVWSWMHLVAPQVVLTRHLSLPKIGKFPLKIALISDLHAGPYKKRRFFLEL